MRPYKQRRLNPGDSNTWDDHWNQMCDGNLVKLKNDHIRTLKHYSTHHMLYKLLDDSVLNNETLKLTTQQAADILAVIHTNAKKVKLSNIQITSIRKKIKERTANPPNDLTALILMNEIIELEDGMGRDSSSLFTKKDLNAYLEKAKELYKIITDSKDISKGIQQQYRKLYSNKQYLREFEIQLDNNAGPDLTSIAVAATHQEKVDPVPLPEHILFLPNNCDEYSQFPTGLKNVDQKARLQAYKEKLLETLQNIKYRHIGLIGHHPLWESLLAAIALPNATRAIQLYQQIPVNDPIKKILASAHSDVFIKKMLNGSLICSMADSISDFSSSTVSTILDTELNETVINRFSFKHMLSEAMKCYHAVNNQKTRLTAEVATPSHHCLRDRATGFCPHNSTGMLLAALAQCDQTKHNHVVWLGLDVNRDDAELPSEVVGSSSTLTLTRIDVHDEGVWHNQTPLPLTAHKYTSKLILLNETGNQWATVGQINTDTPHPALANALREFKQAIKQAKDENIQRQQAGSPSIKIDIILPTGYDSSVNETADCSKYSGQTDDNRRLRRFTKNDFKEFNKALGELITMNREIINSVHVFLEGGYNDVSKQNSPGASFYVEHYAESYADLINKVRLALRPTIAQQQVQQVQAGNQLQSGSLWYTNKTHDKHDKAAAKNGDAPSPNNVQGF